MLGNLGIVALIVLTVFVSAVRPLARASGRLDIPPRMIRLSLLSVPAVDADASLQLPLALAAARSFLLPLLGALLLVLKIRRVAFRPLLVRRLKIPPHSPASPLSD